MIVENLYLPGISRFNEDPKSTRPVRSKLPGSTSPAACFRYHQLTYIYHSHVEEESLAGERMIEVQKHSFVSDLRYNGFDGATLRILPLMLVAVSVIYYFSPNVEQDWRWVIPGSLVAVVLWLVVSLGFKLYVENFANYNVAYGSIGGAIVLLMWFYLSGIALLIGGELNAEIVKAAGRQARQHAVPPPAQSRRPA